MYELIEHYYRTKKQQHYKSFIDTEAIKAREAESSQRFLIGWREMVYHLLLLVIAKRKTKVKQHIVIANCTSRFVKFAKRRSKNFTKSMGLNCAEHANSILGKNGK
jgi:hypothetical protein